MDWFRFYSSALHDPKVQRLRPEAFKAWVNLLCLANEGRPRGALPGPDDIAFALRVTVAKAISWVDELVACGLLERAEDGQLTPHNWGGRQMQSDASVERVRKHREKVRGTLPITLPVTLQERYCNALEQNRTEQRVPPTPRGGVGETDTGTADEPFVPPPDTHAPTDKPYTYEPIGKNSAAEVRRACKTANELYPLSQMVTWTRSWLHTHHADVVIPLLIKGSEKAKPESWIAAALRNPDNSARASPRPERPRPEDRIHRAPRPERRPA